jgi:hypothetical protein
VLAMIEIIYLDCQFTSISLKIFDNGRKWKKSRLISPVTSWSTVKDSYCDALSSGGQGFNAEKKKIEGRATI